MGTVVTGWERPRMRVLRLAAGFLFTPKAGAKDYRCFAQDDRFVLPAAGVVVMEVVGGGEGDDPEADDEGADCEDPFADRAVVLGEARSFADAKDLTSQANDHEEDADGESDPGHGHGIPFYLNGHRCGKRGVGHAEEFSMPGRTKSVILLVGSLALAGFWPAVAQTPGAPSESAENPCGLPQLASIVSRITDPDRTVLMNDYLPGMVRQTRMQWYPLVPLRARPPENKKGCTLIEFTLHADGKISDMKMATSSGDVARDHAAWAAITSAAPFSLFPASVKEQKIVLRFAFLYNEPPAAGAK